MTDTTIDFHAYPVAVKEAWGFFEALRRLGFPAEVLFFHPHIIAPDNTERLGVVLQWNGSTVSFFALPPPPDWAPMIETFNHAPESVLQQIWDESYAKRHGLEIILTLRKKGIELPA